MKLIYTVHYMNPYTTFITLKCLVLLYNRVPPDVACNNERKCQQNNTLTMLRAVSLSCNIKKIYIPLRLAMWQSVGHAVIWTLYNVMRVYLHWSWYRTLDYQLACVSLLVLLNDFDTLSVILQEGRVTVN